MEKTVVARTFDGAELSIETGWMAGFANGAVMVRQGDTVVLATATASRAPRPGIDFFPLTCDYEEKMYAVGRIPGAFFRREGRPGEAATLASRMIDRPMRPLFPKDFRNDVQIVATVLSTDQVHDPTILALIGAGAAVAISDIPHGGPIAACRMGMLDGQLVENPGMPDLERSHLDLVVAGTKDAINMVEAGAQEVSEETLVEALSRAHERIKQIISLIEELVAKVGKPDMDYPHVGVSQEIKQAVSEAAFDRINQAFREADKTQRDIQVDAVKHDVQAALRERFPGQDQDIAGAFESVLKSAVRQAILNEGLRPDGRRLDEIRPIWCEAGVLPRTHGSAVFTRGQTQALSVVTLGTMSDQQRLDGLGLEEFKRYMHHYNFPPFSVGEARPLRSPGRREIGHGALAERAVKVMVPPVEEFPYAIRIVTEILSSNGSTSMASVCGSTLALMDAGVPIKAPVSGIAMGLVTDESDSSRYAILSDIQGMEDALGDMDFKVAGTRNGVTALQMDIKVRGLTPAIFRQALEQARQGRMFILGKMEDALRGPRSEMSTYAPRIITMHIHPDKIRDLIGPGGKTIRKIQEETGCQIDIEDDGKVFLATVDEEAMERAVAMIRDLTESVEVGRIYKGKVVRIMPFGAFVEILPRQDGLVHISQLAEQRVNRVEDVVNIGDEIMVKVTEIDDRGRVNLSRKLAISELAGQGVVADGQPQSPAGA
ncbi:MAG: polyribonucleotide nucleotidyltransferase [Candidatus Dormibacteraeota bacterium]|jgi:polyribonucleotide nucleotidyltransferase|nr:polyribonucleotide nucleotidyltransferase [Candidatus Dormibacteraeota bacterium]